MKDCIDFEAIASFYNQLREILKDIHSNELSINEYYDLSLILNLVMREHLSTLNNFYYTYAHSLIRNGINDDDITSSEYLFAIYFYVKTKNATLLYNITANDLYETENFHRELENDIWNEKNYIEKHSSQLDRESIKQGLDSNLNFNKNLIFIIENIFIHKTKIEGYESLKACIEEFIDGKSDKAVELLKKFLLENNFKAGFPYWILTEVYKNLMSYGLKIENGENEYSINSLNELL